LKKTNKQPFGKIETLISQDTKVDGIIHASGTIRIDGIVVGGIDKAEGVIIGETGIVNGNISSVAVSLAGKTVGNIEASDRLELLPGSTLNGDIKTTHLSISEGANFNGGCSMLNEKDGRKPSPLKNKEEVKDNLQEEKKDKHLHQPQAGFSTS
jgi:cytoskeletal protein CcmA (bactofilin family)